VTSPQLTVGGCLADAFRMYRTLFARSLLVAGAVYGALFVVDIAHHFVSSGRAQALAFISFVLTLAGQAIVSGAIVELVGNVHDGRPPRSVGAVLRLGRDRVFPLVGALLFYGIGVGVGLLLFIVPGLMIAARWSLLVPVIVLEELGLAEARDRSTKLVQERTWTVLGVVLVTFVLCSAPFLAIVFLVDGFWARMLLSFVASTLTVAFFATVTAVLYYSLADPERPVYSAQSGSSSALS
jgi:hypothetical protein